MSMKNRTFVVAAFLLLLCGFASSFAVAPVQETDLPKELLRQLIRDINDNANNFRLTKKDLKILNEHLKYERQDLNGDGMPEFFLYIDHSDWCGAGGNCTFWVYQKRDGRYKLLLEDKRLRARETMTNGYRDLASEFPMGFCAVNVQRANVSLYKYDGQGYQFVSRKDECIPFTPPQ
jgi:hypothetical protein